MASDTSLLCYVSKPSRLWHWRDFDLIHFLDYNFISCSSFFKGILGTPFGSLESEKTIIGP